MDYLHYVAQKLFTRKFRLYRDEEDITGIFTIDSIRYEIASSLFDNDFYCLDLFLITPERFSGWFDDISMEIVDNARGMRASGEDGLAADCEESIYSIQLKNNIAEFVNIFVPSFTSAVEDGIDRTGDTAAEDYIKAIIAEIVEQFGGTELKFLD